MKFFSKLKCFFINTKNKLSDFFFRFKYATVMSFMIATVFLWDMLTKFITEGKDTGLIKGFISIFSTHNTGAAWSILRSKTWILILISVLLIVAIIVINCLFKKKNYFYSISVGLILGGAISNLFDRIKFGYVRDFIKLDFIDFPVFNLADSVICVGVVLLFIYLIFMLPKTEKSINAYVETNENLTIVEEDEPIQKDESKQKVNDYNNIDKKVNKQVLQKTTNVSKKSKKHKA